MKSTTDNAYCERLQRLESAWWKRLLNVQAPYRWNLRRLVSFPFLEVGCGVGRNLTAVSHLGFSVGVDHNVASVRVACSRGVQAFDSDAFLLWSHENTSSFATILFAHVLEHMSFAEAKALLRQYLSFLSENGQIVIISPQHAGFRSDSTHVDFVGKTEVAEFARAFSLVLDRDFSFPFPGFVGSFFKYNERVFILKKRVNLDSGQ